MPCRNGAKLWHLIFPPYSRFCPDVGRFRSSWPRRREDDSAKFRAPAELEYRAKLVELHYSGDLNLLQKFVSEADESKTDDSHAAASARIKREFADTDQADLSGIQKQALRLFRVHTKEMEEKYGERK